MHTWRQVFSICYRGVTIWSVDRMGLLVVRAFVRCMDVLVDFLCRGGTFEIGGGGGAMKRGVGIEGSMMG